LVDQKKKNQKENSPTAFFPLRIAHVFGSAARRSLRALIGAALFSKNFPDSLNAPKMRSGNITAQL